MIPSCYNCAYHIDKANTVNQMENVLPKCNSPEMSEEECKRGGEYSGWANRG